MLRIVGVLLLSAIALVCAAGAVGLIAIGHSNGWTSDGPGMLLVMLGIPTLGFFGFLALSLLWTITWGRPPDR